MLSGCEVLINGCGITHVLWTRAWFSRSMAIYSYESMVCTIVLAGTVDNNGPYGLGKLPIVSRYLKRAID